MVSVTVGHRQRAEPATHAAEQHQIRRGGLGFCGHPQRGVHSHGHRQATGPTSPPRDGPRSSSLIPTRAATHTRRIDRRPSSKKTLPRGSGRRDPIGRGGGVAGQDLAELGLARAAAGTGPGRQRQRFDGGGAAGDGLAQITTASRLTLLQPVLRPGRRWPPRRRWRRGRAPRADPRGCRIAAVEELHQIEVSRGACLADEHRADPARARAPPACGRRLCGSSTTWMTSSLSSFDSMRAHRRDVDAGHLQQARCRSSSRGSAARVRGAAQQRRPDTSACSQAGATIP